MVMSKKNRTRNRTENLEGWKKFEKLGLKENAKSNVESELEKEMLSGGGMEQPYL